MPKEGIPMSEYDLPTPPAGDISAAWGFHLLQAVQHLEDKMDAKLDGLHTEIDRLETKMDTKIDALETKMDTKIDGVRQELDQKIDGLRYWSWATIIIVIMAAITTILTVRA
jgi:hypothetical protein